MATTHDIFAGYDSCPNHPPPLGRAGSVGHGLAFYPVLVTQGFWVRWNTLRLSEPAGPRAGVVGQGPQTRLLIVGDSSAAGVGVATQSQALSGHLARRLSRDMRLEWQVLARCGDTTPRALARLKAATPRPADIAVVALGVNDITHGTPLNRWLAQTAAMLDHLTGPLGVKHVYYSGLPPLWHFPRLPNPLRWTLGHQAQKFDRALHAMLGDRPDVTWITLDIPLDKTVMAEDGFHPGEQVYRAWAASVARCIKADQPFQMPQHPLG